jgi:hypothetical protein
MLRKNPRKAGAELYPLRRLSAWRPVSNTAGRFLLREYEFPIPAHKLRYDMDHKR